MAVFVVTAGSTVAAATTVIATNTAATAIVANAAAAVAAVRMAAAVAVVAVAAIVDGLLPDLCVCAAGQVRRSIHVPKELKAYSRMPERSFQDELTYRNYLG